MMRKYYVKVLLALLALAICTGTLQAVTTPLALSSTTLPTLTCDIAAGPTPVTVGVTLVKNTVGTYTVYATGASSGLVTVVGGTSAGQTLVGATSGTTWSANTVYFTFVLPNGCEGMTTASSTTFTFTPYLVVAGQSPAVQPVLTTSAATISAPTSLTLSPLAPTPSAVTLTCVKTASSPYPQPTVPVNVYSSANGGTKFYLSTTAPAWLTITDSGGSAFAAVSAATAVWATAASPAQMNLSIDNTDGTCHGLSTGTVTNAVTLQLNDHMGTGAKSIAVKTVVYAQNGGSTISASPSPVAITYTKGSHTYSAVTVTITNSASSAVFLNVDSTTFPAWLNVSPLSHSVGSSNGTTPLSFAPTANADALAPGSYSGAVHVQVATQPDLVIPVTLQVQNPPATLSVAEGTTRNFTWQQGTPLPTVTITPISSDSPVQYQAYVGVTGSLQPLLNGSSAWTSSAPLSGVATSFGSPITVTFLSSVFAGLTPGPGAATATVHIIPTNPAGTAIDVVLTLTVTPPTATLTGVSPATVPTMAGPATLYVTLSGTGFVTNTVAGVVVNGAIVSDTNVIATVNNPTSITLQINLPSTADANLPFGKTGTVVFGVCNPQVGNSCSIPTNPTMSITVGNNPTISAVTSASSYIQVVAPQVPVVAPYDMVSIFGRNFCVAGGTGCTGSNSILYGSLAANTEQYLSQLTPDSTGTLRYVTVTFQTHPGNLVIGTAPILFATNTQINALVPSAVNAYQGGLVDIVVSFGATGSVVSSNPYTVQIVASDPGVFTLAGSGQGNVAALSPAGVLNGPHNTSPAADPAGISPTQDSDTVQLYVSGLGIPDSDGSTSDTLGASLTYAPSAFTCLSASDPASGYFAAATTALGNLGLAGTLASNDGAVLQYSLINNGDAPPCFLNPNSNSKLPTVTVGGVAATVTYAGWVWGSVAGLYQINIVLPNTTANTFYASDGLTVITPSATAQQFPVVVTTASGATSQSGAYLTIVKSLSMHQYFLSNSGANSLPTPTATFGTATALASADTGGSAPTWSAQGPVSLASSNFTWNNSTGTLLASGNNIVPGVYRFTETDAGTGSTGLKGTVVVTVVP